MTDSSLAGAEPPSGATGPRAAEAGAPAEGASGPAVGRRESRFTGGGSAAPSHRHGIGLLALPAILLTVLILGSAFAIAVATGDGSAAVEATLPAWIPWLIALNHTVVFVVVLRVLREEGRSLGDVGWTRLPARLFAVEIGIGLLLGAAVYGFATLTLDPFGDLVRGSAVDIGGGGVNVSGTPLSWLLVAVVFPFVEETVYRGYGIGVYGRRIGVARAFAISTLLFGLLHWGQGTWGVFDTAVIGALYGLAFLWRRNLWSPTVGHVTYNALVIALAAWL